MTETTYEVLARILRDNEAEAARTMIEQSYKDGLDAASARIRFAMVGLKRPDQPEWRRPPGPSDGGGGGGGDDPGPEQPPSPQGGGGGKVIEADYTIVDPFSGKPIIAGQIQNS